MACQFFVGGNFKMNPGSVQQKKNIIDILNQADLDPAPVLVEDGRTRHDIHEVPT
ncbi:hypothetical protein OG21DRAFT_1511039 [Imleria badia]|nr:hypothetical protein OG21DRAFT_1511039 [Imleria badia]